MCLLARISVFKSQKALTFDFSFNFKQNFAHLLGLVLMEMKLLRKIPLDRLGGKRYATPYLNSRTKISKRKKDEQNCQRFKKTKEVQPNAPSQRIAPHLFFPDRTENRTLK